MNLPELVLGALVWKFLTEGGKKTAPEAHPRPPAPPPPTSPPASSEPAPPKEPKPLPAKPTQVPWPGTGKKPANRLPADYQPPVIVEPGEVAPQTTVPKSRQPNKGKPEPVYVPPQPTKSPDIHKPGGYTPPQPQVKQQKGQAVSQTEEAAVIARERAPGKPYWRPRARPSPAEVKAANDMLKYWKNGRIVFAGPRSFSGRRMFLHTKHGPKKAVEVWEPAPPFV